MYVFIYLCARHCVHVELRAAWRTWSFPFAMYSFQSNSTQQAWQQAPLPAQSRATPKARVLLYPVGQLFSWKTQELLQRRLLRHGQWHPRARSMLPRPLCRARHPTPPWAPKVEAWPKQGQPVCSLHFPSYSDASQLAAIFFS